MSLVYVSTGLLAGADEHREVRDIVAVAAARNAALKATGALVLAKGCFAQVLEGERAAIDELMLSIRKDPRHKGVNVVDVTAISERRFPKWSMAYVGNSTYVSRHIAPLLPALQEAGRRQAAIHRLVSLMEEFLADETPLSNSR